MPAPHSKSPCSDDVPVNFEAPKNLQAFVAKQGSGHVELRSNVSLPMSLSNLGAIEGRLTVAGASASLSQYDMTRATPVFGEPIRVKRWMWNHFGHWYLVD